MVVKVFLIEFHGHCDSCIQGIDNFNKKKTKKLLMLSVNFTE